MRKIHLYHHNCITQEITITGIDNENTFFSADHA
uniref:Uncharacterized protein n=1 Tax=Erwinia amylovora ATCC BAA-2158 TaxID=889211 RepID=E5B8D3_ERWAM|nr:hypothetical protein predicted by Glimmer/Critica [Erwinia amylovora ATCC BAA-2158]